MSLDATATDLKAFITAAAKIPALDLDEIKARQAAGTLPRDYIEVYLERRYGGTERMSGRRTNQGRRLSTRTIAWSVTNGRTVEDRLAAAFEADRVTLDGERVRVHYESGGGTYEQDGDRYVFALTDWTFVL